MPVWRLLFIINGFFSIYASAPTKSSATAGGRIMLISSIEQVVAKIKNPTLKVIFGCLIQYGAELSPNVFIAFILIFSTKTASEILIYGLPNLELFIRSTVRGFVEQTRVTLYQGLKLSMKYKYAS